MDNYKYKGCVILYKAPIDKVAAKVLVERRQKSPIPIVSFWAAPQCSDDQRLEWESEDILAIDLGGDKYNYTRNKVGSATEFMAKYIVGVETTPAEKQLVEMANKNNKTGYLKGFYMAIAWTMRELYELYDDHIDIMERVGHVVRSWLDFTDGVGLAADRTDADVEAKFQNLAETTKKCGNAPFTPESYLRQLWRLGDSEEEIRARVSYWIEGWKAVKQKQAEAKEEFKRVMSGKMNPHWEFSIGKYSGIFLYTDNKFLTREATTAKKDKYNNMFDIVAVANSDGRISALSYNLDLVNVAGELLRKEPGRWFHNEIQAGLLLNGGLIYKDVVVTGVDPKGFVELLRKYPPRRLHQSKAVFVDTGRGFNKPFAAINK